MPMPVSLTSNMQPVVVRCASIVEPHLALGGELDRVAEQVEQHLAQVAAVEARPAAAHPGAIVIVSSSPFRRAASATTYLRSISELHEIGGRRLDVDAARPRSSTDPGRR